VGALQDDAHQQPCREYALRCDAPTDPAIWIAAMIAASRMSQGPTPPSAVLNSRAFWAVALTAGR
jgi:hypothetical protein